MAIDVCPAARTTSSRRRKRRIKAQWAQVQNQLQRRNDLIPNLVETVKGYAAHEAGVFKDIADARSRLLGGKDARRKPSRPPTSRPPRSAGCWRWSRTIRKLKADEQFKRLMDELAGTENRLATERMRYNELRAANTTRSGASFPSNVTAKMFGFKEYPYSRRSPSPKCQEAGAEGRTSAQLTPRASKETSREARTCPCASLRGTWLGAGRVRARRARLLAQGAAARSRRSPPPINQSDDPMLQALRLALDRPRQHGRAHRRHRRRREQPVASSTSASPPAASGRPTNNGTTWTPIFDDYPVSSIGDIAIAPSNPDVIYVGTGEPNNRQSSSFGAGVYKSTDAGKTFEYVGLKETQSIARIVVHPKDPNIVYVAALGHLFGPNHRARPLQDDRRRQDLDEHEVHRRGHRLHRRRDGSVQSEHPVSPRRISGAGTPWGFNGGGPGSGIWKTTDGGKTWTKLTGNGLPDNPIIGRIGLDIARSKPSTIYASIEVGPSGGTGAGVNDDGTLLPPGQRGGGGGGRRWRPRRCPAAGSGEERHLAIGRWRQDVAVSVEPRRSAGCTTARCASIPTNPEIAYQGGAPFFKTDRRRQDVAAGAGDSAQRPSRDLDRSARTAST